MGLDMYLTKKHYIGAYHTHKNVTGKCEILIDNKPVDINFSNIESIIERVAYWRKANQIHKWFVDNVQEGKDECTEHYVSYEQLMELVLLCRQVLQTKDALLLPPIRGFFFGTTVIDEYYYADLKYTIETLTDIDPNEDYYYCSSW